MNRAATSCLPAFGERDLGPQLVDDVDHRRDTCRHWVLANQPGRKGVDGPDRCRVQLVEGRRPQSHGVFSGLVGLSSCGEPLADSLPQLAGGFLGECNGRDATELDAGIDQGADAFHKLPGFAAAGARLDENGLVQHRAHDNAVAFIAQFQSWGKNCCAAHLSSFRIASETNSEVLESCCQVCLAPAVPARLVKLEKLDSSGLCGKMPRCRAETITEASVLN